MEKILKTAAAAVTVISVLSGTALTAYGENIQLTDYRYESAQALIGGYVLLDYYKPYETKRDEDNPYRDLEPYMWLADSTALKIPTTVLKPDGTEMFKPGKYYVKYQLQWAVDARYFDLRVYVYPQNKGLNRYIVYDIDTDKAAIMDNNGNTLTDFVYDNIRINSDDIYWAEKTIDGVLYEAVINAKTMTEIYATPESNSSGQFYISEKGDLLLWGENILNSEGMPVGYSYKIFDFNGDIKENGQFTTEDMNSADIILGYEYVSYLTGDKYYALGSSLSRTNSIDYLLDMFGLETDVGITVPEELKDPTVIIDSKKIGGKTYYAVFKELSEGETETDYRPSEEPSAWAKGSIDRLKSEGFLFNEASCRYSDNISRCDFAVLAAEVFCRAKGLSVEDYITENNIAIDYDAFTDTENVYAILACELGIMEETDETNFSPARGISYDEAVTMLNSLADLLGVNINFTTADFTETDRPALSREQTYVCLCRIYEAAIS